jgi:ferritin-like metal-binding protein YciE
MAGKVSNPRDLFVLLLGELLHVERRLAGSVLRDLASSVTDDELQAALRHHLDETERHVERVENAFRRIEVAPSAHRSAPFESAVAQHDELAGSIVRADLADVFHAQAALHTELWETAAYTAVIELGSAIGYDLADLRDSLDEERRAEQMLAQAIGRLSHTARDRPATPR